LGLGGWPHAIRTTPHHVPTLLWLILHPPSSSRPVRGVPTLPTVTDDDGTVTNRENLLVGDGVTPRSAALHVPTPPHLPIHPLTPALRRSFPPGPHPLLTCTERWEWWRTAPRTSNTWNYQVPTRSGLGCDRRRTSPHSDGGTFFSVSYDSRAPNCFHSPSSLSLELS
jgi:hypothetical protein